MGSVLLKAAAYALLGSALVFLANGAYADSYVGAISLGSWKLDAPVGSRSWLVIHQLPTANDSSFPRGDPALNARRAGLEVHMACPSYGNFRRRASAEHSWTQPSARQLSRILRFRVPVVAPRGQSGSSKSLHDHGSAMSGVDF